MAAKVKENRALRNSLINQLREIRDVAQSATEQPALRALLKRRFARAQSIFEKFEHYIPRLLPTSPLNPNPIWKPNNKYGWNFSRHLTKLTRHMYGTFRK
jgi:hypothetical protein